jgi:hypothetical protein
VALVALVFVTAIPPTLEQPAHADAISELGRLPGAYQGHDGSRWGTSAVWVPDDGDSATKWDASAYIFGGLVGGLLLDQIAAVRSAGAATVVDARLPVPRAFTTAVWDPTNKVAYVIGGYDGLDQLSTCVVTDNSEAPVKTGPCSRDSSDILKFDPAAGITKFLGITNLSTPAEFRPREHATAVWNPGGLGTECLAGCAYILGGRGYSDRDPVTGKQTLQYFDEIWRFEPPTKGSPDSTLKLLSAKLPWPRCCGSGVWEAGGSACPKGCALFFGGYDGAGIKTLNQIVRFVPDTSKVSVPAVLPSGRYGTSAVWVEPSDDPESPDHSGRAYILGGTHLFEGSNPDSLENSCPLVKPNGSDPGHRGRFQTLDEIVRYDPDSSERITRMPVRLLTPPLSEAIQAQGTAARGREFTSAVWTGSKNSVGNLAIFGGGFDETCTNADAAQTTILEYLPKVGPPDPPTGLSAEGGPQGKEISLSWNAPENNGGAPIIDYRVYHVIRPVDNETRERDRVTSDLGLDTRVRDHDPMQDDNVNDPSSPDAKLIPLPPQPGGGLNYSYETVSVFKSLDIRSSPEELNQARKARLLVLGDVLKDGCELVDEETTEEIKTRIELLVNGMALQEFDPCELWPKVSLPLRDKKADWAVFDVPIGSMHAGINTFEIAKIDGPAIIELGMDLTTDYKRSGLTSGPLALTLPQGEFMSLLDIFASAAPGFIFHGRTQGPGTTFVDEVSEHGDTREYVVTAVNAGGLESRKSDLVPGTAPARPGRTLVGAIPVGGGGQSSRAIIAWLPPQDTGGLPIKAYYIYKGVETNAVDDLVNALTDLRDGLGAVPSPMPSSAFLLKPEVQALVSQLDFGLVGVVPAVQGLNIFTDTSGHLGWKTCYRVAAFTDASIGPGARSPLTVTSESLPAHVDGGPTVRFPLAISCVYGTRFTDLRIGINGDDDATLYDDRNGNHRFDSEEEILSTSRCRIGLFSCIAFVTRLRDLSSPSPSPSPTETP